ncbi:MAG: XRE family transcriptional regulator [Acutalibacteraceae bacterium]|nr:XRE family transcriptional regulator [Acutalibacteraceae bacterium]
MIFLKKDDFDIKVFSNRFSELLEQSNENTHSLAKKLGLSPATISRYANGIMAPKLPTLYAMADIFDVNPIWLFGFDVPRAKQSDYINLPPPNITEDYTTFPVEVEIAAGYEHIALEDWEGDTVDISDDYLRGHNKSDFFVLRVKGESMYPEYQDGDKVLVLKQSVVNYSGQVGVAVYDGELATLKKIEYTEGESWVRLVPINPAFPPKLIENEDLEYLRVLGIPKLIIREVNR